MLVTEYIKNNGLQKLQDEYKIVVSEYDNYCVLNYNQIESPKMDPLVQECRALILDKNTWEPLSRAFDRFFNLGEGIQDKRFDISKVTAYEKVDGSLMQVWWNPYNNEWTASTRKMAHAEGETVRGNTFRQIFDRALGKDLQEAFKDFDKGKTYIFECVSPETRIVKLYQDYALYLLSTRNLQTGKEDLNVNEIANKLGVRVPKKYKFSKLDDVMMSFKELDAFDEGYVCVQEMDGYSSGVYRVKVKNPSYLAIAHLRDNGVIGTKRIAQLVLANDEEEYLVHFEEDREYFVPYIKARAKLMDEIARLTEETKGIENQKEFALKVKDYPCAFIMFKQRRGFTLEEILSNTTENGKFELLEKYIQRV